MFDKNELRCQGTRSDPNIALHYSTISNLVRGTA